MPTQDHEHVPKATLAEPALRICGLVLPFPPQPKFLPVLVRESGCFVVRIYHYPLRRPGSRWGWSLYGVSRIAHGLRATPEGADAAARRAMVASRRGTKIPGRRA